MCRDPIRYPYQVPYTSCVRELSFCSIDSSFQPLVMLLVGQSKWIFRRGQNYIFLLQNWTWISKFFQIKIYSCQKRKHPQSSKKYKLFFFKESLPAVYTSCKIYIQWKSRLLTWLVYEEWTTTTEGGQNWYGMFV